MNKEILVAGATGRTGRIIIKKLIHRGFKPHALVRDIPEAKRLLGKDVIFHQGDVRDINTLTVPMSNVDVVVSAIGTSTPVGKNCPKHVDYEGVANLVKVADRGHVHRFIMISSIAVTHTDHPLNCFGKVLDWKRKGEDTLRKTNLDYAIIRPGGLKDTRGGVNLLTIDQGDRIMGTISREDVANVILHAILFPRNMRITFEVIESNQKDNAIWTDVFSSLSPD